MKITLFDINPAMVEAFNHAFRDVSNVKVVQCSLQELPYHTAIITAGNCFATMTGGIDFAVRDMFGYELQDSLQNLILQLHRPMFIGETALVCTPDKPHGSVIYAPTMHTPEPIGRGEVYLAAYAALHHAATNNLESVACPGLGAGVGQVAPEMAAAAMRSAYDDVMKDCAS